MTGNRVLRLAGQVTLSLVLVAAVAGLILGASARWPAAPAAPVPAQTVAVPAGRTTLVCPGPPQLAGGDVAADPGFDPTPEDTAEVVTAATLARSGQAAAPGRYVPGLPGDPAAATALEPAGGQAAVAAVAGVTAPGRVEAEPVDGARALAVGAALARTGSGDLRGLAGATCQEPVASAWLVGGGTEVGSSARLVLANPGATPATVTLRVWGATGPLEPGQAGTVLVPAGTEQAVLLEAVAPDQSRLAVHLEASGGQVAAWIQDSSLRGFVPTGTDLAAPAAEPATTVVVPGVLLAESAVDDVDAALLRIVNPGPEPATVSLRLLGPDGEVTVPGAEQTPVEAGSVTDVPLAGVPAGAYAAELVSDVPVTAAALLVRVGQAGPDAPDVPVVERAWTAAATSAATSLLALPDASGPGDAASVLVTNPGDADVVVVVRVVARDAALREPAPLTVPARSTAVLDPGLVAAAAALEAQVDGPGAVSLVAVVEQAADDGALLTALGGLADPATAQGVPVRLDVP